MTDVAMQKEEKALNLLDLLKLFWKRLWLIALVAILVGGACFAYKYTTYEERYTSASKIYVLNTDIGEGLSASTAANLQSAYLQLALMVVEDCKELILSETVLERVVEELDLNMSAGALAGMIKVENGENSRILQISVTSADPELSCKIVNAVSEQGAKRVHEIMKVDQMSVVEYGKVPGAPSNGVDWKVPFLLAVVAGLLIYGICFAIEILDDKVNDVDDVEKYLGLIVLGDIPHKSDDAKAKRGSRYYGKY